jgi:hypothetical protein
MICISGTALVPDEFSDVGDYTADAPTRAQLARRTANARSAATRARTVLGCGPDLNWKRKRIVPSRDEWTP